MTFEEFLVEKRKSIEENTNRVFARATIHWTLTMNSSDKLPENEIPQTFEEWDDYFVKVFG